MKFTVDRKEEGFFVVINRENECFNVDARICPEAKEGDILNVEVLREETKEAKSEIEARIKKLLDK